MILILTGVALITIAAAIIALFRRNPRAEPVHGALVLSGCALALVGAGRALLVGGSSYSTIVLSTSVPGGDWTFRLDPLSAAFLLPVFGVGAASALFGVTNLATDHARRAVWFVNATLAVLIVSIAVLVLSASILPFMCAWEIMAIGSYLLIVTDHERADVRRAGLIYLIATHTGMLALIAMFAIWGAGSNDWSFAALAAAAPGLAGGGTAVLLLALVGFGFKAGLVPLHFWLPPAHSAAPAHVSAVLSGVVIKTGIYGLLRVLTMLGPTAAWFGWTIFLIGVASGVLGVLWALAQHDIKRLLAYHSVENIGIILMGMGIGVLGTYYGHPVIAVAGYAGAVLHTINHALFKSLLFLGAGAVYRATHTLHMEELGGLAARMPHTWLAFAIGATAIVGLPPLNGFVSEWLVFQGMFRAGQADEVVRLAALGVPALGLIGALALACFAKVSGITFLGSPRSAAARDASDPALGQRVAMLSLAGACVLLGIVPTLGVGPAIAAASSIAQVPLGESVDVNVLVGDAIWIGVVAALLCALVALGWLARRSLLRRQSVRNSATWACGYDGVTPRMQYSASSFASPLLNAFGAISGVREQRDANSFASHAHDLVLDGIVRPLWERIRVLALRLRPLQQGRLHAYLIYVMVALVTLLAYVAFEAGP